MKFDSFGNKNSDKKDCFPFCSTSGKTGGSSYESTVITTGGLAKPNFGLTL